MMKNFLFLVYLISIISVSAFAQNESLTDSSDMEVFLIDAYVKQEPPYIFILTFYTSSECLSKVVIDGKYEYDVTDTLSDSHSAKIDITDKKFSERNVNFVIETIDSRGNKFVSEEYEFDLPYEPKIEEGSTLWTLCLFAGSVFLVPAPGYVNVQGEDYFSLTKEIPIISFRSKNRNYPASYFSLEYTYIFNAVNKSFARLGYKRIFPVDYVEYISPGITAYSNFNGQNGIGPEVSVGWFTLFDTFTFYTRYRYNFRFNNSDSNFHEINLGFYTRFFSLYF